MGQVHLQASPVQAAEKLFSLAQAFTPGKEVEAINSQGSFRSLSGKLVFVLLRVLRAFVVLLF